MGKTLGKHGKTIGKSRTIPYKWAIIVGKMIELKLKSEAFPATLGLPALLTDPQFLLLFAATLHVS